MHICSDVFIVTSELPGLGKTEEIHDQAFQRNLGLVTFPISGPIQRVAVLQRLRALYLPKYRALHLDIASVPDPVSFHVKFTCSRKDIS